MKNLNSEKFCPDDSDLASRASARILRLKVEQTVCSGSVAIIDLTKVISISESYADELFAVLVEQHGIEWFSDNIQLQFLPNANYVLLSIATAIRHRLENQKILPLQKSIDELIAAKKTKHLKNCNHSHA